MKCYYEELGVARDATDGDIKTAYRKLALRWHPDKNLNNSEEAKEKFQTLQQAYEVLSDQHERAWYDNHREQILRGKNSEYQENCLDLFQYFTVSCFKGYGDDSKGFYKTYAEVFEKIAAEDAEFMDDEEEIENIPKFGDSNSSYEEVVGPFYAYWQSYCTKKTYTWLCPHDITGIKDRRVLRYIEKDMKKIVQQAKRERNEEVRNLVSFIRKRDKRVQANKKLLEEKAALNRQKQEQNRLEQIRKRNRELEEMRKTNANVFNEGFEEQLKQLEQEYDGELDSDYDESDDSDSDQEKVVDYVDDLYCVACNKAFTNGNAFINHETSKKHKENIERLVREMKDEEKSFEIDDDNKDDSVNQQEGIHIVELDDLDELDCDFDDFSDDLNDLPSDLDDIDDELLTSEIEDELNDLEIDEQDGEGEGGKVKEDTKEEPIVISTKKAKSKKNKKAKKAPKVDKEDFDEEEQPHEVVEDKEKEANKSDAEWAKGGKKSAKKSKNKKAQKKPTLIEAADPQPVVKESPVQESLSSDKNNDDLSSCDTTHSCVTCKSSFPSKNKLFAHLKKTNHGVYLPKAKPSQETNQSQTTKKSKGKRK